MADQTKEERYLAIAKQITELVGGKENVQASTHCATRLRIVLKNYDEVDTDAFDAVDLAKGAFIAGNQLQIIFGAGLVNDIHAVFSEYTGTAGKSMAEVKDVAAQKMNPVQAVIKSLSDVFIEIMPGILAAALPSGLTGVLSQWDVVESNATLAGINRLVSLASSGIFSILPLAVTYSATKRYGGRPILGLVMGAIMLSNSLADAYAAAQGTVDVEIIYLFGIPVELVGFQGGIIIALMMGFVVAKLDKFFERVVPDVVKLLFSPMCTLLISTFLLFLVIGPIGRALSNGLTNGLLWLTQNVGLLGYMVFAGVQQLIVITGLHHMFGAVEASLLANPAIGNDFLNPLMSVALMGQGGAVIGYMVLHIKSAKTRELCIPSFVSTLFGISEPAIFGVNLRWKFPLVAGCIAGAIAGGYVFLSGVTALGLGTTALPGLAICDPVSTGIFGSNGYVNYLIAHLIALVCGAGAGALPRDERGAAMENEGYGARIEEAYRAMDDRPADPARPMLHLAPVAGTLADPNGLVQAGDGYHLMHLNNPLACEVSGRTPCVWAHLTTSDFVTYRREPIALYPDTARDRDGVYSGSALVRDGRFYLFYTGNVRHHGDFDYIHEGREQNVLRAESADGVHFGAKTLLMTNEDYPETMTQHVRDPQVVERCGETLMLLGARTRADTGCVLVYRLSEALDAPELLGALTTPGPFGYMWECPDFVAFGDESYLLACPQGIPREAHRYQNAHQCGYFALPGGLDACLSAGAGTFPGRVGAFEPWDYGFDFYAARTLRARDGRVLLQGWMGMPDAPYGATPTAGRGWDQVLAMPRELALRRGRIYQRPLRELAALDGPRVALRGADADACGQLSAPPSRSFRLDVRPQAPDADVAICLREDARLVYRAAARELVLSLGPACGAGRGERRALVGSEGLTHLELYVDASTLEAFVNDGAFTMTSRLFGEGDATTLVGLRGQATFVPLDGFSFTVRRS